MNRVNSRSGFSYDNSTINIVVGIIIIIIIIIKGTLLVLRWNKRTENLTGSLNDVAFV